MLTNELAETLSLNGSWDFSLGEDSAWGKIVVPGCWEAQGYSKFIDGPARYRRSFQLPEGWRGKTLQLEFDAASYACEIYLNGMKVGEHFGLWTPFAVQLPPEVVSQGTNTLEITIYKPGLSLNQGGEESNPPRYPMRESLAGFIPDVSTTFGGLWQDVRLRVCEHGIEGLRVDPDLETGNLQISCQAQSALPLEEPEWKVEVFRGNRLLVTGSLPYSSSLTTCIQVPEHELWEPDNPVLYTVKVTLMDAEKPVARATRRTGFRRLSVDGDQLLFNGRPFMVRGILSWGWEPESIAPAYTLEQARSEIRKAREMGFNLVKLCLLVPNQAYFDAADEEGMLLWEELPMWQPKVTNELRDRAPVEYAEITKMVRHHPSVAIYSLGCELNAEVDADLLQDLDQAVRANLQPERNIQTSEFASVQALPVLICDNSGSGESYEGLDIDFADFRDYHPYYDIQFFKPLLDNWRRDWQPERPWIFGEFCDADTFRDPDEIIQELQRQNGTEGPWWLTTDNPVIAWRKESKAMLLAHERLQEDALPFSTEELRRCSYEQAQLTRKYTLEALRRRKGMGGYILTGLRDTPISTSGIWDDLGRAKWTPEEFCRINGESILCLEVGRRRRWHHGGDRPDRLDCFNFRSGENPTWYVILHSTEKDLRQVNRLSWQLMEGDQILSKGDIIIGGSDNRAFENGGKPDSTGILASGDNSAEVYPGKPSVIGTIHCNLPLVSRAVELNLHVSAQLQTGKRAAKSMTVENQWQVFVYPVRGLTIPENMEIYDPNRLLDDWLEVDRNGSNRQRSWLDDLPRFRPSNRSKGLHDGSILLTTVWDEGVLEYVHKGGKVLLLQQGNGPLPAIRAPFWREAIKLIYPHRLWETPPWGFSTIGAPVQGVPVRGTPDAGGGLQLTTDVVTTSDGVTFGDIVTTGADTSKHPTTRYTGMQFFGLASDTVFDTSRMEEVIPGVRAIKPILRRLDAREFHISDYLFEAEAGRGVLLGCSLRLWGGMGSQPGGLWRNVTGMAMLEALLQYLKSTGNGALLNTSFDTSPDTSPDAESMRGG